MKLSKHYTTVTPLSKLIALILFILLPLLAFFFGMHFQEKVQESNIPEVEAYTLEDTSNLPTTEIAPY